MPLCRRCPLVQNTVENQEYLYLDRAIEARLATFEGHTEGIREETSGGQRSTDELEAPWKGAPSPGRPRLRHALGAWARRARRLLEPVS